jgi:hypothetical protein
VVAVVVVVAIIAAAAFKNSGVNNSGVEVTVTAINIVSSDNACGVNGKTVSGYSAVGGESVQKTLVITNGPFFSCTINSVSATTSGFSISGANVPLSIPAGGSESLSFFIGSPNSDYSGVLTLDIE